MAQEPVNLAAFLTAQATDLVIQERPIPTPGEGEILIRNRALALNPVDWKRQSWGFAIASYPTILGSGKPISYLLALCAFRQACLTRLQQTLPVRSLLSALP